MKHFESETHYYPLFHLWKIITIDHKTIPSEHLTVLQVSNDHIKTSFHPKI